MKVMIRSLHVTNRLDSQKISNLHLIETVSKNGLNEMKAEAIGVLINLKSFSRVNYSSQ